MMHEREFTPEPTPSVPGGFNVDRVLAAQLREIFTKALPPEAFLIALGYTFQLNDTSAHHCLYRVAFHHEGKRYSMQAASRIDNAILERGFIEMAVQSIANTLAQDISYANPKLIAGSSVMEDTPPEG
jgi:hypothetical protein